MWTGRQTMASIEAAISKLHGEESRLDQALRSAVADAERLRAERSQAFKELARIKLDEMGAGRLVDNLDAAERQALRLLEDRRHRMATLAERKAAAVAEAERAEADRHTAAGLVEQALEAVEALRAKAEAAVQAKPDWRDAKARFDEADAIATEAEKKAAQSEAELGAKKRPYDGDPLFTYLWGRGYGTQRYAAGNLARMIDRALADFIGYQDARANYAMLVEIPVRLREHASGKRAAAGEQRAAVAQIERREMVAAGIDALERALAEARHRLAAADATLETKRGALKAIDAERDALISGGADAAYTRALDTIAQSDAADDIGTLYAEARRTHTSADERIVRRIEDIDSRLASTEKEIAELRRTAREVAQRRVEVEDVRDRFRSSGYDHPHATFGNEREIARILGAILEGAVRSGILWDLIRGGFGYRPSRGRPDFGSPDLPFPFPIPGGGSSGPSGGDWREPGSRGGWFPPLDLPSSGGSGSDRRGGDDDFTTDKSF